MGTRVVSRNGWSVVYEKAIRDDGSLYFPERLDKPFLDKIRRTMGSYIFANQYQNEVIPEEDKKFKKEWLKYYDAIPSPVTRFCLIDPAISTKESADYTALIACSVDLEGRWYVEAANRYKKTPTEIVNMIFDAHAQFNFQGIGVEDIAYQKVLLHLLYEEGMRRNIVLPLTGIKYEKGESKGVRILQLVPRFEWGMIYLNRGLHDLENELMQFPRGAHDDLIDALANMERIAYKPTRERTNYEELSPNHPDYERHYIRRLARRNQNEAAEGTND